MRSHLLLAFSLANLCFFNAWREVLSPQAFSYFYYWKQYPGYALLAALMINVLLLATFFFASFYFVRRFGGPLLKRFVECGFLLVCLRALNSTRQQFDSLSTHELRRVLGRAGYLAIVFLVFALLIVVVKRYGLSRVARSAAFALLILFPFGVVALVQATWLAYKYGRTVKQERQAAPMFDDALNRPRVLWLVFDEMDETLAFAARPANLSLPELDRLRTEAFFATKAFPPAGHTSQSLPALLTGQLISAVKPVGADELMITIPSRQATVGWSTQPNIFSAARAAGFNTALVGWYNPYCRVIGDRLTSCQWESATQVTVPDKLNVAENLLRQDIGLLNLLPFTGPLWTRLLSRQTRDYQSEHLVEYRTLMPQAERAAANQKFGLTLIHLPVPHAPYIYDRTEANWNASGARSYLDNLALADRALGDVRRSMERAGTWESTTIVLSSDHWWRSDFWRPGSFWTAEDNTIQKEDAAHGIPFLVKLAGQKTALTYDAPFNTVLTHDLILDVLNGRISNASQLALWLDAHRTIGESPYQSYEDGR